MFGNPETTPGGKALKFYTSVRLDIRRIAQIKKGDEVMGGRVRVKVVKNKVAAPFRQTEFDLMYNEGISKEGEIIALGEKMEILTKSGNSYKYGDVTLGRGYDATRQFLKENANVREELLAKIRARLSEGITVGKSDANSKSDGESATSSGWLLRRLRARLAAGPPPPARGKCRAAAGTPPARAPARRDRDRRSRARH